jgi:hypothetical protein
MWRLRPAQKQRDEIIQITTVAEDRASSDAIKHRAANDIRLNRY